MPAGAHDGRPDDGDVELVLLLLHHKLGQGFGVGVGVGPVANEPRRDVAYDAVVHPPVDTTDGGRDGWRDGWRVKSNNEFIASVLRSFFSCQAFYIKVLSS